MSPNKKIFALALSLLFIAGILGAPGSYAPGAATAPAAVAVSYAAPPPAEAADPNIRIISPRNINYNTEEAFVGSLERSAGFDARLSFPNTISVLVPRDGMFLNMPVSGNDWVNEGDPLATFSVVANELEIDEAALALELAQSAHRREVESLENSLADARARLDALKEAAATTDETAAATDEAAAATDEAAAATGETAAATDEAAAATGEAAAATGEAVAATGEAAAATGEAAAAARTDGPAAIISPSEAAAAAVALRRAELAVLEAEAHLDFVSYNSGRNLDFMRARLDDLRERSEEFTVYAPISGIVYEIVYFAVGRSVSRGQFMCRISNPEPFQLVINASNLTQLRLGAQVSIETSRRDAPSFTGRVIGNTTLLGRNESESRAVVAFNEPQEFLDFAQGSVSKVAGLRFRVLTQQADIQNVLLATRRAVSTESSYRFVNILEDGLSKKRYVVVGLSNMEYTQILDGIKAGDVLILN